MCVYSYIYIYIWYLRVDPKLDLKSISEATLGSEWYRNRLPRGPLCQPAISWISLLWGYWGYLGAPFANQQIFGFHCYAIFAMQSLLCNHCYAIFAMQSLLCSHCYAIFAMRSLLCKSKRGPFDNCFANQTPLLKKLVFKGTSIE